MDSSKDVQAEADGVELAAQLYAEGLEALERKEFAEAADSLAQALQYHAEQSGDTSPEAATVGVKYATALLGCARSKGTSVLGNLDKKPNVNGAGCSKDRPPENQETIEGSPESDLELAWEVAETSRLGIEQNPGSPDIDPDLTVEVHEVLADLLAEMENFQDSVGEYELALQAMAGLEEGDVRWEAEIHFKFSIALELADNVPQALLHVTTAREDLSALVKQKEAERQEAEQRTREAATASAAAPPQAPAAADAAAAPAPEAEVAAVPPQPGEGGPQPQEGGAAVQAEGGGSEELPDAEELAREVEDLKAVIKDLQDREEELAAVQGQEATIKEQLKAVLGVPSSGGQGSAGTAGTSETDGLNKAGGASEEAVQDLGVIRGKRKRAQEEVAPEKVERDVAATNGTGTASEPENTRPAQ